MNDKPLSDNSQIKAEQENHEPKSYNENQPIISSTGISNIRIGDSQPDSKD